MNHPQIQYRRIEKLFREVPEGFWPFLGANCALCNAEVEDGDGWLVGDLRLCADHAGSEDE